MPALLAIYSLCFRACLLQIVAAFEALGRYTSPTLQMASVDCAIQAGASAVSPFFGKLAAFALLPIVTICGSVCLWLLIWGAWRTEWYKSMWMWWEHTKANRRLRSLNRKNAARAARGERQKVSLDSATSNNVTDTVESHSPEALRSRAKTNFLITCMALLFLQHSAVSKAAFSYFSCR